MTRRAHVLTRTNGNERPGSIIFFDTETTQLFGDDGRTEHILRLGVAQHYRKVGNESLRLQSELIFDEPSDFWDYIDKTVRHKSTTYLVAHNIIFDLSVVNGFSMLAKHGWKLKSFYSKGLVSIFRWSQGERKIQAIDNSNLFAGKLSKWGDIFKFPKLNVDFDNVNDDELITYCRRDVEIMVTAWRKWLEFITLHDLGTFKSTVGATAFNAWRHRFMPAKVHIHDDKMAIKIERDAFKGGRVECLFQGRLDKGPYYYLDVNNMYGYILANQKFPAGLWGSRETTSLSMLVRKLDKFAVVARVNLDVDEPLFPYTLNGHTCYPLGSFETTLTTPELKIAFERGWLRGVSALTWYRQEPLFENYVKTFGDLRMKYSEQENDGFAAICKLLVNSLYGKTGQLAINQKVIGSCSLHEVWSESVRNTRTNEIYRMLAVGGQVFEEHKGGESYHSFPGIAAHVTAYARLYLQDLRSKVDPGHVFYMDTDSLIVDEWGMLQLKHLFHPSKIGALKIEHVTAWVDIFAPKDYRMEDRVRLKGIRPEAVEQSPGVFSQDQWERLSGKIHHGHIDGYTVNRILKHQARVIHSGVVSPSGWVEPFELSEGQIVSNVPLVLSLSELLSQYE